MQSRVSRIEAHVVHNAHELHYSRRDIDSVVDKRLAEAQARTRVIKAEGSFLSDWGPIRPRSLPTPKRRIAVGMNGELDRRPVMQRVSDLEDKVESSSAEFRQQRLMFAAVVQERREQNQKQLEQKIGCESALGDWNHKEHQPNVASLKERFRLLHRDVQNNQGRLEALRGDFREVMAAKGRPQPEQAPVKSVTYGTTPSPRASEGEDQAARRLELQQRLFGDVPSPTCAKENARTTFRGASMPARWMSPRPRPREWGAPQQPSSVPRPASEVSLVSRTRCLNDNAQTNADALQANRGHLTAIRDHREAMSKQLASDIETAKRMAPKPTSILASAGQQALDGSQSPRSSLTIKQRILDREETADNTTSLAM